MDHAVLHAFFLTLLAGLSTGIGSCIAFLTHHTNKKFLSVSLGFSAGVMIYVSMIEIFSQAQDALQAELGEKWGSWSTVIAFFGGMLLIALIDKCIPSEENPHEVKSLEADTGHTTKLMRMGVMTALAIAIHNFPEGLATFVSALQDPSIAIPIVVAIAIHNIPEGIALIGWLLLMPIMSDLVFGILFAGVAGIMVFISLDELLPSAREYGEHHLSIYGLICGMAVMAISLLLFL